MMIEKISIYTETLSIFTGLFVLCLITADLVLSKKQGDVLSNNQGDGLSKNQVDILSKSQGDVLSRNQKVVLQKTCTPASTFKMTFGQPFEACIESCQRRQRCQNIMYRRGMNMCCLKDSIDITALKEEEPVCLYTNIDDWERKGLSPCDKNSCGLTETCITSSTDPARFECVPSECPSPQALKRATVLSNVHDIGLKTCYKCTKTFIETGNPFITCQDNATWTTPKSNCLKLGRKPNVNLGNADLVSVVGAEWQEGTVAKFSCRPGYQGQGNTTTHVIDSAGNWQPPVVQCCNENITQYIWGHSCIQAFNGSYASSFADMNRFCNDRGGLFRWVDPSIAKHVFKRNGYLWLASELRKNVFFKNLKRCIEISTAVNLQENFSSYTIEQLIEEIVSRNLVGHWTCNLAKWLAPGEPNGGDSEVCFVFRNGTYSMYDIACSSWQRSNLGFICKFDLPRL